jgi:AAA family ATP:ADP antiporter
MSERVSKANKCERLPLAMACISVAAACMMGGYEFVRSTAASLFIAAFGSENLPYAMAFIPVLMAACILAYGSALSRLGSRRTLMLSLAASALVFAGCYAAVRAGMRWAAAGLYVFTEVYIVVLVEQFWAFINSTLDQRQARFYNGPILGGATLGSVVGGAVLKAFAVRLGSESFILLAAAALLPTLALSLSAYRLAGEPLPSAREESGPSGPLNLKLVLGSRVLLLIAAVVALSQVFSTAVNLRFYEILESAMPLKDERSAFLGSFWANTNGLATCLQFILTPLLLKRLSLGVLLVGVPAVHLLTAGLLLARPGLGTAGMCLMLFKGLDYSLFRASKELLYIPLSYDARYRAKQVVDSFTYRFSKGATAGVISLFKALDSLPGPALPAAALAAAAAWVATASRLAPLGRPLSTPGSSEGTAG